MLASPVIRQISSLDSDKTFHLCKLHENSIRDGSRGENCLSNFFCLWFMPWDLVLISAPSSEINNQLLIGPSCEPRPLIGMREIVRDCSLVSHKPDTSRLKSVQKNVWLLCEHLLAFAEVRSSPECKVSAEFYQVGNRGNEIEQTIDLVSSARQMWGDLWAIVLPGEPQPVMWLAGHYLCPLIAAWQITGETDHCNPASCCWYLSQDSLSDICVERPG